MKIGIEYTSASNGRGVGRYISNIVWQLSKIDDQNQYIIYADYRESFPATLSRNKNFSIKEVSYKNKHKFIQFQLPKLAKTDKLDVLWCPANEFPVFFKKNISLFVTIHDVIFFRKEREYKDRSTAVLKFTTKLGAGKPKIIFTDSKYSKKRINEVLKVPLNKIKVIDLKIDYILSDINNNNFDDEILKKMNVNRKKYFYTVLTLQPHKNLKTLLTAFENDLIEYPLIVTGCKSPDSWIEHYLSSNKKMKKKIFLTERISNGELNSLYKNCAAFLFPPLEEGFGLPLLEAQCFDIPVICSDAPPMNEIADKNSILVEPKDYKKYIEEIQKIQRGQIEFDKSEREKHLERFKNWEKTAREILYTISNNR